MRLPQLLEDPTNIDFDQYKDIKPHGISLASQLKTYNRIASKLPVFSIQKEEVVQIFNQQLENCGVEYFDYFLLHNMNIHHYNSVVKSCKMFEHM